MSKKSRDAIRSNLAKVLEPPPPTTRRRGANLDGLLDEYAPGDSAPAPQIAPIQETPPAAEAAPVSLEPVQQVAPASDSPSPLPETAPVHQTAPVKQAGGFTMVTHYVSDEVVPTLDAYSQSVLQRLLRLTWGHQKDTCKVGLPKLSEYCNISVSQVRRAVRLLIQRGLIEQVVQDFEDRDQELRGTVYRVLLQRAATRQRGATPQTAPISQPPNKERVLKESSKKVDASLCPDCRGDGYYFEDPRDRETLKLCRHIKLK